MDVNKTVKTRSKPYSDDLRAVLCQMATVVSVNEIIEATALKRRTVERFLSTVRNTGKLRFATQGARGRPTMVDTEIATVSPPPSPPQNDFSDFGPARKVIQECIKAASELYLDEILETIQDRTGKTIALSTIWRYLDRNGVTLKKVSFSFVFAISN